MPFILTLVVFVVGWTVCIGLDSDEICGVMRQINCGSHYQAIGNEEVCCTDGQTYPNKCFYVQAKCINIDLNILHDGPCTSTLSLMKVLTGSTTTHSPDHYVVSEAFCKDTTPCPNTMDPLCGKDNRFYLNLCEFNKEKCINRDLQQQTLSNCKDKQRRK